MATILVFLPVNPYLQDAGMWQDALRVCKEYIPHKLSALQDEYEREMMDKSTRGAETLIQQVATYFINTMIRKYISFLDHI